MKKLSTVLKKAGPKAGRVEIALTKHQPILGGIG